jgi:hypothetical protein
MRGLRRRDHGGVDPRPVLERCVGGRSDARRDPEYGAADLVGQPDRHGLNLA